LRESGQSFCATGALFGQSHVVIKFHYETYVIKDLPLIERMFSSVCVGTQGELTTAIALDNKEASIRVKITPDCAGDVDTRWYYNVECPHTSLICQGGVCFRGSPTNKRPSKQITSSKYTHNSSVQDTDSPLNFILCGTMLTLVENYIIHDT